VHETPIETGLRRISVCSGNKTCVNAQRAHPLPKLALLQMATYGTYCLLGSKLILHTSPAARGSVLDSRELILLSTEVMGG
jgi:hypothetical protein